MADRRILLIGGVSLLKGRVKGAGSAMAEICEKLEPTLREIDFTTAAPFKTISIIFRFGQKTELTPEYGPVDKQHSELSVAVEMQMDTLRFAGEEVVRTIMFDATVDILIHIAKKYGLPRQALEDLKAQ